MSTARETWRLAAVIAVYAVSLLLYLRLAPGGLLSAWFVFVAMVCVLGLAFVAQPVVALRLPTALRPIRRWEAGVFRRLGVRRFGALLRTTPLRWLNTGVYLRGGREAATVRSLLESAEASHLVSAALTAPFIVYGAVASRWPAALAILLANVCVNLFPIAHLRVARARLEHVTERRGGRIGTAG